MAADAERVATRSGLEVDVLIETPRGVVGVEIKNRETAHSKDATALRTVADALGKDWAAGLVVYRGSRLTRYDGTLPVWAVPVHRLF